MTIIYNNEGTTAFNAEMVFQQEQDVEELKLLGNILLENYKDLKDKVEVLFDDAVSRDNMKALHEELTYREQKWCDRFGDSL